MINSNKALIGSREWYGIDDRLRVIVSNGIGKRELVRNNGMQEKMEFDKYCKARGSSDYILLGSRAYHVPLIIPATRTGRCSTNNLRVPHTRKSYF